MVDVEESGLDVGPIGQKLESILTEWPPNKGGGEMIVDFEEDDDAVRKIEEAGQQKWKSLQQADTKRKIEFKLKWQGILNTSRAIEKKGQSLYRCKAQNCKYEDTGRNEEQLFLHWHQVHEFWRKVEF